MAQSGAASQQRLRSLARSQAVAGQKVSLAKGSGVKPWPQVKVSQCAAVSQHLSRSIVILPHENKQKKDEKGKSHWSNRHVRAAKLVLYTNP